MTRRRLPSFIAPSRLPATLNTRWQTDMDGQHIIALRWSPDGQTLAAATADGPIALFDHASGLWRATLPGHALGTLALAWHPNQPLLASAGQDGKIRLWNTETCAEYATLPGGSAWVERLAWSTPRVSLASVARGRNATAQMSTPAQPPAAILASAAGKVLRFWDAKGTLLREARDHSSTIADIAWMPGTGRVQPRDQTPGIAQGESSLILAIATYGGLTLKRPDRDEPLGRYAWKGSTLVIAWSPDGSYIATGDQDSTVHFWITRNGQDLQMWGYPTKVRELAWDSTSRYLATGGGTNITIWDCSGKGPEGTRPLQLAAHEGQIAALMFQHRNAVLASGCSDGLLAVWSVGKSKHPLTTKQFAASISQLAWSPDDHLLAVGTEDGDVAVFDTPA